MQKWIEHQRRGHEAYESHQRRLKELAKLERQKSDDEPGTRHTYYVVTIKNETREGQYEPGEAHTLLVWREARATAR